MHSSAASRRPRNVAVALGAAVLAWLVVRNAAIGLVAAGLPPPAIARGDPTALIATSGYDRQAGTVPSAHQTDLLARAADGDALYYQPLLARAAALDARGNRAGAIRLAEIARSRDPRALAVRVFLLERYLRQGRVDAAVAEMNPIAQLANGSGAPLMQMLSTLSQDPHGAEVVAKALRSNPAWRDAFVRQASGAGQALAFRTLATPPSTIADDTMRGNREAFLARLIAAGDYSKAYLAWINFLPPGQAEKVQAIYDGSFANLPGVAPFNWTLSSDETAVAQRVSDSSLPGRTALDVNYFGNDTAVIATETLLVPPGNYSFRPDRQRQHQRPVQRCVTLAADVPAEQDQHRAGPVRRLSRPPLRLFAGDRDPGQRMRRADAVADRRGGGGLEPDPGPIHPADIGRAISARWHACRRGRPMPRSKLLRRLSDLTPIDLLLAGDVVACLVLGGASNAGVIANALLQLGSVAILGWAMLPGRAERSTVPLGAFGWLLAGLGLLALLQILPLPPALWGALPGRARFLADYRALGIAPPWLPLSLAPDRALASLLALLPCLATFVLTLRATANGRTAALWMVIGVAVLSIVIGALQLLGGSASRWYVYAITNSSNAVGLFANRNHLATLFLVTLPFVAALAARDVLSGRTHRVARRPLYIGVFAFITFGAALNGSSAGLALLVPCLCACVFIFFRGIGKPLPA